MNMTQKILPISYRRTLLAMLLLAIGLVILPNMAKAAVTIDQAPLTVRGQVAPNIVLMLDDSGSMNWDIMPDWDYLPAPRWNNIRNNWRHDDPDSVEPLINAGINGVYYNPSINYDPPPKADGASYPQADFTQALVNGFDSSSTKVSLSTYRGKYDSNDTSYDGSSVQYSISVAKQDATSYAAGGCPSDWGESGTYEGYCSHNSEPGRAISFYDKGNGYFYVTRCNDISDVYDYNDGTRHDKCMPGISFFTYTATSVIVPPEGSYLPASSCPSYADSKSSSQDGYCYIGNNDPSPNRYDFVLESQPYYYVSRCNDGDIYGRFNGSERCYAAASVSLISTSSNCADGTFKLGETRIDYNEPRTICSTKPESDYIVTNPTPQQLDEGKRFFIRHYIGANNGDCAAADLSSTVCVDPGQTDPSDPSALAGMSGTEVLQNAANWFSYYRNRILMAKSGLMNAFEDMDTSYRFGFGSINGNNDNGLPAATSTQNSVKIADVKPFGDGTDNTQKKDFWQWIVGADAANSTPLRQALQAAGMYFQTAQPWQSTDPTTGTANTLACRQAYTILTTDGMWNSGNTSINDADGSDGPLILGANGQRGQYKAIDPFKDNNSATLADVAMHYWNRDLQTNISNEVPTSIADQAFWQHMATFTIGMGFLPPYNSTTSSNNPNMTPEMVDALFDWSQTGSKPSILNDWGGWLTPRNSSGEINNINDLVHAGVNGHGGFFSATSPQSFAEGLKNAIARATERAGTGASLSANSTRLDTGTVTYQAIYRTSIWSGELNAYSVDPDTGAIANAPNWSATQQMPAPADREIYTYNSTSNALIEFNSAATLSSAQQTILGTTATTLGVTTQQLVDYLRGDHSQELSRGGTLRNRKTALGDIVSSQPVYTGAPTAGLFNNRTFTGSSSYSTYVASQSSVTPVIWVASNDGMLHGFNAQTGTEVYAYLPAAVITSGIAKLADPDYGNSVPHEYFNDGELTVADAYINNAWATIVVGTTGRGSAKTIYALDVTDPSSVQFLWERSASDGQTGSSSIGQITAKPIIAQTADGTWSVLVGNGYNSSTGTATLLQFDLATGALTTYATNATTDNGLAAPQVWMSDPQNGISTVAFAGDLAGNVWSFDLTTPASSGTLLYSAKDADGKAQPITGGMLAAKDPKTDYLWLFFGTGSYLNQTDLADKSVQTWYGIIVKQPNIGQSTTITQLATGRSVLRQRTILAEEAPNPDATPPTLGGRAISTPTENDMEGKLGWYIDLVSPNAGEQGERMTTPNQFHGNMLIGNSRIPESTDPCNPSGKSWIMALDPFTGAAPDAPFFDLNNDRNFDDSDRITHDGALYVSIAVGFTSVANNPIFVGNQMLTSFDDASNSSIATNNAAMCTESGCGPGGGGGGGPSFKSWRELVNH